MHFVLTSRRCFVLTVDWQLLSLRRVGLFYRGEGFLRLLRGDFNKPDTLLACVNEVAHTADDERVERLEKAVQRDGLISRSDGFEHVLDLKNDLLLKLDFRLHAALQDLREQLQLAGLLLFCANHCSTQLQHAD